MRRAQVNLLSLFVALAGLAACNTGGPGWENTPSVADPDPAEAPELRSYKESYYAALGKTITSTLSLAELADECAKSRMLWLGDHHDDRDLHTRQREFLTALCVRGMRPVLLLEAIGSQDETIVHAYLAGQIDRTTLHRTIRERWPGSWLDLSEFDGAHYQALLDLAKQWQLPVLALEPTPRLRLCDRDQIMAARIREASERWPQRLLVVHVGSAHLLGNGNLVGRVGEPGPVIGAKFSTQLAREARALGTPRSELPSTGLVRTSTGVTFFVGPAGSR